MAEYIEREAAIELLSQPITMSMCLSTEERHHKIAQQRIDRYLIENIPAADVRPVVRGRWEYNPGDNIPYCSECMMPQDSECNFCPNCGASMSDGEDNNVLTKESEEVSAVRCWLTNGADMREES